MFFHALMHLIKMNISFSQIDSFENSWFIGVKRNETQKFTLYTSHLTSPLCHAQAPNKIHFVFMLHLSPNHN
jgi:hypothetical protein